MLNAAPVWESGNAGEGVIAAMVDDGLDFESDDLADNFVSATSLFWPAFIKLLHRMRSIHTTSICISLFRNLSFLTTTMGHAALVKSPLSRTTSCGIGIAHKAKVAGIRILSGPISDADEASALNYGYDNTSIYSCSWGPPDDGRSMRVHLISSRKPW